MILTKLSSFGVTVLIMTAATLLSQPSFAEFKRPKISSSDPYLISEILVSEKNHTLLPKGSIINLPERHKKRFVSATTGDYVSLKKFIQKNYGWLMTYEVSLDEARGTKTITESKLKSIQQSGKVVIAVYKKNPISVMKPQPKDVPTKK